MASEDEPYPCEIEIDLKAKAKELGIKYFVVSVTSLWMDQRLFFVPASAIERAQRIGVNYHGYVEMGTDINDPESYFVPDARSMIQLPWNKELAWVPSFAYMHGKPMPQCPRRILIRQIMRAKEKGYVLKTGIEPEFSLLKKGSTEKFDPLDDTFFNSRAMMRASPFLLRLSDCMEELGWGSYKVEHEAAKGQYEVAMSYSDALTTADRWHFVKFMIQSLAEEEGMRATFMPYLREDDLIGNGMHIHHSLWTVEDDREVFPQEDGRLGLSDMARYFLAGQLKHARNNSIIFLSTVNSYKRFRFPDFLYTIGYGIDHRLPTHRIVTDKGKINRLEFRSADAAANPYLAHAALLAAGLDGIDRKLGIGLITRSLDGRLGLSDMARYFLAGQLKHARNNSIIFLSTVNSYMDLLVDLLRFADVFHRLEFRSADAAANPYLAHAALLAAGLDGIDRKLELDEKREVKGENQIPPLEEQGFEVLAKNLGEALSLFEKSDFAKEVFGEITVKKILKVKKEHWKEYSKLVTDWERKFIDAY